MNASVSYKKFRKQQGKEEMEHREFMKTLVTNVIRP